MIDRRFSDKNGSFLKDQRRVAENGRIHAWWFVWSVTKKALVWNSFLTLYRISADSKAGADGPTLENAKATVGLVNHALDRGPNIPTGTAGSPKRSVLFQEESPLDNR